MNQTLPDLSSMRPAQAYEALCENGMVRRLIELMRDEDLGLGAHTGDITAIASGIARERDEHAVEVRARAEGIACGLALLPDVFDVFAPSVSCEILSYDSAVVSAGDPLVRLAGLSHELHVVERPLLNIIGRLSGVATRTAAFVRAARDATPHKVEILDTRKTTPGLRMLEKYAVLCGGGTCHRIGLYDAALVKDNHIASVENDALAAHIERLATAARSDRPLRFFEVEVDTLDQLEALLELDAGVIDIVMLDNMGPDLLKKAVTLRDEHQPTLKLEASGGVSLDTIGAIARSGVDRISVGSLTHGATWLDVGMDAV